ncbi:amidohydrolase family protein [Nannocystaceae bacterium ST9]
MNRLVLVLSLALVSIAAPSSAAPPVTPPVEVPVVDSLILTNATVWVGDGTVLEQASIRIEKGEFVEVRTGVIAARGDVPVIDVQGKLVTPGLIAADTQLGLVEIGLEGSTRDDSRADPDPIKAGYDPATAINADSSVLAVQAIEGVTTAAVSPVGGLLSGQVAWIDLLPGRHGELVAAKAVAVAGNLGQAFAGSRAAGVSELIEVFEDAAWYRLNQKNFDRGQARELAAHPHDLRALWPVIDRQVPLIVHAQRASDLLALIELAEQLDIRITIVGAAEGWKVAEQLAAAKIPVVIQPTQNLPGSFESLGARLDNAALLAAAGVSVAIAHLDTHNVRNMTQEAGIAVANGLDPKLAIGALTLEVAEAYGMDKDYGSIAVGKVANLVIWDGRDPFELSCWAEQVYVRGQKLEMRSRQTELRDRYFDLGAFEP